MGRNLDFALFASPKKIQLFFKEFLQKDSLSTTKLFVIYIVEDKDEGMTSDQFDLK